MYMYNFFRLGTIDINVANERGWTALMFAARHGQLDCAKVLLDKKFACC